MSSTARRSSPSSACCCLPAAAWAKLRRLNGTGSRASASCARIPNRGLTQSGCRVPFAGHTAYRQHFSRLTPHLKRAGLPGFRLHECRHHWTPIAAINGVNMVTIAKLLGHALVETIERYTHLSEQSVSDAADRVSRIHVCGGVPGRGMGQAHSPAARRNGPRPSRSTRT